MTTIIIFIVIGLILFTVSIYILFRFIKISKNGVPVEGVIFDLEDSNNVDTRYNYPVVRFNTTENEWITETYKIGLFYGLYKKGTKVKIVYNPYNPTEFLIRSRYSFYVPVVLAVVSLFFLAVAILNLLDIQF